MKTLSDISAEIPANIRLYTGQPLGLVALAACGLLTALFGLSALVVYSQTPGAQGETPRVWPRSSQISRDHQRSTLVVFLHPRCPCSRATLRELERLLVRREELRTVIVMLRPEQCAAGWEQGILWDWSQSLSGVHVQVDRGGAEAQRFGVATSGHACLYDNDGRLQFSGGITPARGHEGENRGITALKQHLAGHVAEATNAVFGCPLFSANDRQKCE